MKVNFSFRRSLAFFLFFSLMTAFCFGQSNSSPSVQDPERQSELKLSGTHYAEFYVPCYPGDLSISGPIKNPVISSQIGIEFTSGDLKLVSQWRIDANPFTGFTSGQGGSWDSMLSAKILENALYWNPGQLKLGFGYQFYSWGTADKQNPTDNINPRDYTVGLDSDKIPVFSLSGTWYANENISLQGVYVPFAQDNKFPLDFKQEVSTAFTSASVDYINLNPDLSSFVAGGRLSFRYPAADFSVSYLYDWDKYYTPVISVALGGMGYYPSAVSLERYRVQRIGLDAKTTAGSFGIWLEGCLSLTSDLAGTDSSIRNPFVDWTAGIDTNYGPNDTYYVNIQYMGEFVYNYDSTFTNDYPLSTVAGNATNAAFMQNYFNRSIVQNLGNQNQALLQGLSVHLKWQLLDGTVTPELTAAYFLPFIYDNANVTRYGSLVLKPEIDFQPADSFHIFIGADLCYAWIQPNGENVQLDTTKDMIGIYTPSNNVYLKFQYAWNFGEKK